MRFDVITGIKKILLLPAAIVLAGLIISFACKDDNTARFQTSFTESGVTEPIFSPVDSKGESFHYRDSSGQMEIELCNRASIGQEPFISIKKWDGECLLKIGLPPAIDSLREFTDVRGSKLILRHNEIESRFYMRSPREFEWELVLAEKPDSNVFTFDIETDNLLFYYQDPDTFECYRGYLDFEDNVPGSYAIYYNGPEKSRFEAGKAFHIYRPRTWDHSGDTCWCDLEIDTSRLIISITVPSTFLNSAVYPVIIDPTFGNTSKGASGIHMDGNNYCHMVNYNDYQDADGDMQTAYICGYRINQSAACTAAVVVYSYDSDLSQCDEIATSAKIPITKYASSPDDAEWFNGSITGVLADQEEYIVSWQGCESSDYCLRVCADYTGTWGYERRHDYSEWGTNDNLSGYSSNGYRYSVYVEYTESGGPTGDPFVRVRKIKRSD